MYLASQEDFEQFIDEWKTGTLPRPLWTHAAHVAVAAYHTFGCSLEDAFPRIKTGIIYYNDCVGTVNGPDSGYHETLTRLWAGIVSDFVHARPFPSRLEAARAAVKEFGQDRTRHRLYYSFDVVRDRRARREWIPPDRPREQL